jgi:hypothetical protein
MLHYHFRNSRNTCPYPEPTEIINWDHTLESYFLKNQLTLSTHLLLYLQSGVFP